jgi:hypothetical protein
LIGRSRDHLVQVGESYFQHMRFAATVGRLLVGAGIACLLHAILPGLFTDKASRTIRHLAAVLDRRQALDEFAAPPEGDAFVPLLLLSCAVAALPWVAGAEALPSLILSLLTFGFPAAYLWAERPREGHTPVAAQRGAD